MRSVDLGVFESAARVGGLDAGAVDGLGYGCRGGGAVVSVVPYKLGGDRTVGGVVAVVIGEGRRGGSGSDGGLDMFVVMLGYTSELILEGKWKTGGVYWEGGYVVGKVGSFVDVL